MDTMENGLSRPPSSMATTAGSGSVLVSKATEFFPHGLPSNGVEFFPSACIDASGTIRVGDSGCEPLGPSATISDSAQDSPVVFTSRPFKENLAPSAIISDSTQDSPVVFTSRPFKENLAPSFSGDPPLTDFPPANDPSPPVDVDGPPPTSIPTITVTATETDSTIFSPPTSISGTLLTGAVDPGSETLSTTSITDSRSTHFGIATDSSDTSTSSFTDTSETFTSNSDTVTSVLDAPSESLHLVSSSATTFTPLAATTAGMNTNSTSTSSYAASPDATTHNSSNDNNTRHPSQFNDVKVPVLVGGIVGFVGVALIVSVLFVWIARRQRRMTRNRLSAASSFFGSDNNRWSTFSDRSSGNMNTISHFYHAQDNSGFHPSIPQDHAIV